MSMGKAFINHRYSQTVFWVISCRFDFTNNFSGIILIVFIIFLPGYFFFSLTGTDCLEKGITFIVDNDNYYGELESAVSPDIFEVPIASKQEENITLKPLSTEAPAAEVSQWLTYILLLIALILLFSFSLKKKEH